MQRSGYSLCEGDPGTGGRNLRLSSFLGVESLSEPGTRLPVT